MKPPQVNIMAVELLIRLNLCITGSEARRFISMNRVFVNGRRINHGNQIVKVTLGSEVKVVLRKVLIDKLLLDMLLHPDTTIE